MITDDVLALCAEQRRLGVSTIQWWSAYVDCGGGLELGAFDEGVRGRAVLDPVDMALLAEALWRLAPSPVVPGRR